MKKKHHILSFTTICTRTKNEHRVQKIKQHEYFIAWPRIIKIGQIDVLFAVSKTTKKCRVTNKDVFKGIILYNIISLNPFPHNDTF